MAQPKTPPISIRLPADVLAGLDGEASEGEARNAVIVRLLRYALATAPKLMPGMPSPPTIPAGAIIKVVDDAQPLAIKLQMGPTRPAYGALAKKTKR